MGILERMKERAQKTKLSLDQERAKDRKIKEERERLAVNESAPFYVREEVWCATCQQDYNALLRKHGNELLAYYLGTCAKGHTVRREITHAATDPYYNLSRKLQVERHKHADDLLTPLDPRFKIVYPDKWRELEAAKEARTANTGVQ